MNRKPVFDAFRAYMGGRLTQTEVDAMDAFLDGFGPGGGKAQALADSPAFYAAVRQVTGALDQAQVDTIEGLLKAAAHWPLSWLAYGFATAWHEARLKPIEEIGKGKGRPYARPGKHGQSQHGRGLVQLTWDRNYEWADKALGLGGSLLKDFDRALEPEIATRILVLGMETGAFAGDSAGRHTLARHLPERLGTPAQYREARRIINGTDRAESIAALAERFEAALLAGGWA